MIAVADVELLRQRYAEAEPLLTASLVVLTSQGGAASPALIQPLAELARIALARGEVPAAERLAGRANAIAARHPSGPTEPLRVLGAVYAEERRFGDGERVLRAALARDQQARAPIETARSLAQLANLLLRAERFGEALPLLEAAIALDQEHLGATHPLIADDYADLGLIYAGLGRDIDASVALYFAIDVLDRGAGDDTPRVAYAELELSTVLRRLGQADDADDAFDDAKDILDRAADGERQHERQI
jgi:tetratricopeptide (TPR) repeat protein